MKLPVLAITTKNEPFYGATRTDFAYITQKNGKLWLADIDEDWIDDNEDFKWDDDPCGRRIKNKEESDKLIKENKVIGFVENKKLTITDNIEVETAWTFLDGQAIPTKKSKVGI